MIKPKAEMPNAENIVIDLTSPQGNVFFLLGTAKSISKQFGWDHTPIHEKMISGDYENLLNVFDHYYGEFVILYR